MVRRRAQLPAACPDELTPTAVLSIRPYRTAGQKSGGLLLSLGSLAGSERGSWVQACTGARTGRGR